MPGTEEFDELREEIKNDLQNNQSYQAFRDNYEGENLNSFIEAYSRNKASYLLYGKIYHESETEEENNLLDLADDYLNIIQQKKLYDMQCLWRAEKIDLPGIEITQNFEVFEKNINHCKFIDPISYEEVEILCEFILQYAVYRESPDYENWQEYPYNPDNDPSDQYGLREWYDYFESHTELKGYNHLEDKRGPKEEKYKDLFFEARRKKRAPVESSDKPYQFVSTSDMEDEFMKRFETPILREQKKAYINANYDWYKEDLSWAIDILMKSDVDIPVKANSSWLEGTRESATTVWRKWLVEAVKNAFEIRQNKIALGLDIAGEWNNRYEYIYTISKEQILEGRKIAGEPEDLNF